MSAGTEGRERALLVERDGPVETLVINDAPRNRMSLEFKDALQAEVERLAGDSSVRAVVIRGAGEEHFSVGMDLKQLPQGIARMGSHEAVFAQRLEFLGAIEKLTKPVIAVLYGHCLGGGLELPLAWGGSARLTRCVGRSHALDMILRARKISGPEALRIGLVTEVWPIDELFQRAQALALELATMAAVAVGEMLRCSVGAGEQSLAESIADERRAVLSTMGTPDQREGMPAILEKRKPRFDREAE